METSCSQMLLAETGDVAGCEAENTMMCHQLVAVAAVFQSSLQCQRAQREEHRGREGFGVPGLALLALGWLRHVGNFLISLFEDKELNFEGESV